MRPDSRIYVAGHRGLVGSALVRRLERGGYRDVVTRTRAQLDLEDAGAVSRFFADARPEYVFLAAAKVGGILANNSYPADFLRANLAIELNVIEAARAAGVTKLLFLGSSCIYPRLAPQPIKEEHLLTGPLEPTNEAYAIAKIAGIKLCESYNRQFGTQFVSVMPTNLYGPGDNFDLAGSHVLPALIRKFHEAKLAGAPSVTVWGSGTPRREFLHVDDMADACVFLMEREGATEMVNVGTGEDVTIAEVAALVRDTVGYQGEIVYDRSKPDGTPRKLLDVGRLSALGWRARIGLREGLAGTYAWFVAHAPGRPTGGAARVSSTSSTAAPWLRLLPPGLRAALATRAGLLAIVGNSGWLAADKVLRLGVGLLVGVLVARTLGPAQLGALSFATALVALFGALGSLGLDAVVVRECVHAPEERDRVLGTAVGMRLIGGTLAGALTIGTALAVRPGDDAWRLTAIVTVGQLFVAFDVIDAWFQSRLQSRYTVAAKVVAFAGASAVRLALVARRAPVEAFAWAAALEALLGAIGLLLVFTRTTRGDRRRWRFDPALARTLLATSWPLVLTGFVIAAYMRIDQVMLAAIVGDAEVGTYTIAVRLAEVWYFVPAAVASSTLPVLLRLRAADPAAYRRRAQQLFTVMALVGYAFAIPTTFLAGWVVRTLYGPAYVGATASLVVLAWTGVFVCLGVARENWMLAEGLTRLSFATTVWGAAVNVALNFALIPRFGAFGAALATLAAQITAVSLSTLLYRRTRPLFAMQLRALTGRLAPAPEPSW